MLQCLAGAAAVSGISHIRMPVNNSSNAIVKQEELRYDDICAYVRRRDSDIYIALHTAHAARLPALPGRDAGRVGWRDTFRRRYRNPAEQEPADDKFPRVRHGIHAGVRGLEPPRQRCGSLLQRNRPVLLMISGAFMILFGLNFTGVIRIGFLDREKRFSPKLDNLRFPGSVLFRHCFRVRLVTVPRDVFLGSALAPAGSSETVAEGMLMLLVYSAGLAIPFVVSAAIFENVKSLLGWFSRNSRTIRSYPASC